MSASSWKKGRKKGETFTSIFLNKTWNIDTASAEQAGWIELPYPVYMPGCILQQLSGGSQVWCVDLGEGSLQCVCSTKPLYYPRDPPVTGRLVKGALQWQVKGALQWQEDRWKGPSSDRETGERGSQVTGRPEKGAPPVTGRPVKRALQWQGDWRKGPSSDREMVKGARAGGHAVTTRGSNLGSHKILTMAVAAHSQCSIYCIKPREWPHQFFIANVF